MISLKQLRYFDSVARLKHFGKAAEQCSVTQPALSMQIQEMEKTLGVQLIERSRGGIMLTEAGRGIARRATRILAETRDIVDFARRQGHLLSGPLHLGVIPSIAPYVLPALLPLVRDKFPDLDLHLRETQTHYLIDELLEGGLDLLLLALPVEHPEIETAKLFNDRFLLAMPKSRRTPNRIRATLELLQQDRLLLLEEGHCLREQALEVCSRAGVRDSQDFRATSLETLRQMVATGAGVTLLPELAGRGAYRNASGVVLRPFAKPAPQRRIGALWRKSTARRPAIDALAKLITEHAL